MEQDLSQLNQIDLECNVIDDDDSFGTFTVKSTKNGNSGEITSDYNPNTGVIINLSDTEDARPMRHMTADFNDAGGIDIQKDFVKSVEADPGDYNKIDTETDYYDDTEDPDYLLTDYTPRKQYDFQDEEHIDADTLRSSNQKTMLDFDDASEELLNGLIDEEMIAEKKRVSQGEVETDYWKKIQNKYNKAPKKEFGGPHFHYSGNPKAEAEMFNADAMPAGPAPSSPVGEASFGCCEALEKNEPTKLLEELFALIGFDVVPNSDGSLNAFDLCDENNDMSANNLSNLIDKLQPYINTCIICPLEVKTGKSFDNYGDWCDWYDKNKKQYPGCADDIKYCDLLCNKLSECHF